MHRKIGTPFEQRNLEFLGEQPLAADLGQGAVEHPVALGGEADDRHLAPGVARGQQRLDMHGLPHGQPAFTRGDHQPARLAGRQRRSAHQVTRFFTVDH